MTGGGVRLRIQMGRRNSVITADKAGRCKNILDHYLSRSGVAIDRKRPSPYGFGVIARPIPSAGQDHRYRVLEVHIGSTSDAVCEAFSALSPEDLYEPLGHERVGLDLRTATINPSEPFVPVDRMAGYAVSPIRVLDTRPGTPKGYSLHEFGSEFDMALNRTMERRFGRPFHLRFEPDTAYLRLQQGNVTARMAVKRSPDGRLIALDGVVLPFALTGSPDDIRDAWYNGLGSATGQGFGWWEEAEL